MAGAIAVDVELERAVPLPLCEHDRLVRLSSMGCHSTAMLTAKQVTQAAKALYEAEEKNEPTTPISETYPDADVEDAYRISQAVTELKLKAGRIVKGHKIGLTSKAMRSITGATEPDYGTMFDNWFVARGQRRAPQPDEPAARRGRDRLRARARRSPARSVNAADVIRATDFVLPVHRDRRHPPEGPGPQHARRQHLRRRGVRPRRARRPADAS